MSFAGLESDSTTFASGIRELKILFEKCVSDDHVRLLSNVELGSEKCTKFESEVLLGCFWV